jgi:hypothetical protein
MSSIFDKRRKTAQSMTSIAPGTDCYITGMEAEPTDLTNEAHEPTPNVSDEASTATSPASASALSPELLALVKAKRAAILAEKEERREERRAEARRVARAEYAAKREAEGRPVRPYRFHDHQVPDHPEYREMRERRMHRDRMRSRRGVDEWTVRDWNDLSSLTPEEKAEHKREQNREAKRRQRERQRGGADPLSPAQLEELMECLADLDLDLS